MADVSGSNRRAAAAWEALLRAHAALVPMIAAQVEKESGLPLSWYDVLLELSRAPGSRLRMQDLGECVVLSRSRVSRIVDEMVAEGLVTKSVDANDRRAILATLTAKGRRAQRRTAPLYLDAINRHFGQHLRGSELQGIVEGLGRLVGVYDGRDTQT
jgi:DNA-binding MarR family transcriptional regulator